MVHNHSSRSYENEFNMHVNEISFSYERWEPSLALRKRLQVIRKWSMGYVTSALNAKEGVL